MILMYLVILVEALWSTRNNLATLSFQLEALRALEADTDITATPVHRKYVMYCRFLGVVLLYASLEILIHSAFNGPPFPPPLPPPPPLTPPPSSPRLPFPPPLPPASPSPHLPLPPPPWARAHPRNRSAATLLHGAASITHVPYVRTLDG